MKLKMKSSFLETSLIYLLFLSFAIIVINSFGITMPDDGWRHLAMAIYPNEVQSWGRVYPHTLYEEFDPWFMWHNLLAFVHKFVDVSNVHIVINSIIYSLLSLWYYLALSKFTKINKFFTILLSFGMPLLHARYFFLRPDILSGLFVLYFLISKNKFLLSAIAIIYAPFYYVFWFYFAFISYVQFILKEYKKMIILIFATIFGFIFYGLYDLDGYIQISQNVLNNDNLIQKYSVGESKPFIIPLAIKNQIGASILLISLTLFSLLLFFVFKTKDELVKLNILLIPLFLVQYRFLHILEPLIYLLIIHIIYLSYTIIKNDGLEYFVNIFKQFLEERTYFTKLTKNGVKIILACLIILFFSLEFKDSKKSYKKLEKKFLQLTFLKNNEFKNKKILFTTMNTSTYMALFMNPSGSYVPGCSLGWVTYNEKNKKTYFDLLINNEKISMDDFFDFLKENSPDYFILDSSGTSNLVFDIKEIEKNGFYFYKIINSKLIFRKHK